ncbi:MAG TPA: hypothetical protein VK850_16110 [Candidatus Binatia bacterium]|nr:hypothetical protein [Candidatus Binatia bacterium]
MRDAFKATNAPKRKGVSREESQSKSFSLQFRENRALLDGGYEKIGPADELTVC